MENSTLGHRINIDQPRWDQSTYLGRAKHFFVITNPLNLLCSSHELENAKMIVTKYRQGENLDITEEELWRAKSIYDSAFHPDTGEKMFFFGRMSAQVPTNMFITGAMLSFYRSRGAVIFWQWFNQSFNAVVNYNNRSGNVHISNKDILRSYLTATSSALATALTFNHFTKKAPHLIQRFGPFFAVAAANFVNIPLIRMSELQEGTQIISEDGEPLGSSKTVAKIAIASVVFSRIGMAVPSMVTIPIIMNKLEKNGTLAKYPRISTPTQISLCGFLLLFATPLCCALFPQKSSISVSNLEPELQERLKMHPKKYSTVYYNKGL